MRRSLCLVLVVGLLVPACAQRSSPAATEAPIDVLLRRMHERLELMHTVARVKWNTQAAIFDPRREQVLLDDVVERGRAHDLNAEDTRAFFTGQMEAAKAVQQEDFQRWQAEKHAPFPDPPDLATLRRKIDSLNGEILAALAAARPLLETEEGQTQLEARAVVVFADVPESAREPALRPLRR